MPPRTRLEQRAEAAHLSIRDFCAAYHEAAKGIGESVHVSETQAKRWLGGAGGLPRAAARRVLEHWWREAVAGLFGPPVADPAATVPVDQEELFVAVGRETREHAITSAVALDSSALEQLHAEARWAARAYFTLPPLELFTDLVRLRSLVRDQLDRTRKPRQEAELYLVLGQVAGLMSSLSLALGHVDSAGEQARAAYTYGRVIDQHSLCAWARSLQVAATFWSAQPRQAVDIASAALDAAPTGTARARLYSVRARSLALIGARDEVRATLRFAEGEMDRAGGDELLDGIGGELAFSPARQALCASTAYIALGDAAPAEDEATTALERFTELPMAEQWPAGVMGAHIDLGTARAMRRDLAGAEDALLPVFDLDPDRRTEALARRMGDLRCMLATRPYRGATEAARIGDRIEDFTARSLGRTVRAALPEI